MVWLDLLVVQGTLKSLLQHHSSKASILRHSAFFTVQISHPYMTTGKTIALTRRTFVGKVMLLFSFKVMSNSSRPHGLQHTRLPCPSPSPGVCPRSYPSHQWCHPTHFILNHIHNNLECVIRRAGRKSFIGNYLAVQWLGLSAFVVMVQSLVRELNHF